VIDTSGKWWVGSEATDVTDFLTAYKAEGYPGDAAVQVRLRVNYFRARSGSGRGLRPTHMCDLPHQASHVRQRRVLGGGSSPEMDLHRVPVQNLQSGSRFLAL
jgi:hypothetical protein